jgi:flagellar basal body rod protein FlgF
MFDCSSDTIEVIGDALLVTLDDWSCFTSAGDGLINWTSHVHSSDVNISCIDDAQSISTSGEVKLTSASDGLINWTSQIQQRRECSPLLVMSNQLDITDTTAT